MAAKGGIKAALKRALKALETYGWHQGDFGDTEKGFCAWGAINYAAPGEDNTLLGDAIRKQIHTHNITGWNDTKGRRKATVLAAFRRAIEAA